MPRASKDTTPRPRPSRGKSGKPPAPPVEGAAGTPQTKRASQGFAEASAPFLPAAPSPRWRGEGRGEGERQTPEQAAAPHPSPLPVKDGEREALATLPALRNTGPPSRNFADMTAS